MSKAANGSSNNKILGLLNKAKQITKEAAGVGTSMHGFLEHYTKGEELPNKTNLVHVQGRKMAEVVIQDGLSKVDEAWGSEVHLYYPDLYAGTTDLVGVHNGVPAIMDFKQTNKPKKEEWVVDYYLQLVAYAEAHNEIYGTEIREGHVFMCSRDLQYQQFDVWPHEYEEWQQEWYNRLYTYYEKHTA